jgi:predicted DNA-binding protein (UPF0251 family)
MDTTEYAMRLMDKAMDPLFTSVMDKMRVLLMDRGMSEGTILHMIKTVLDRDAATVFTDPTVLEGYYQYLLNEVKSRPAVPGPIGSSPLPPQPQETSVDTPEQPVKRGRGRPPGSKNKPKEEKDKEYLNLTVDELSLLESYPFPRYTQEDTYNVMQFRAEVEDISRTNIFESKMLAVKWLTERLPRCYRLIELVHRILWARENDQSFGAQGVITLALAEFEAKRLRYKSPKPEGDGYDVKSFNALELVMTDTRYRACGIKCEPYHKWEADPCLTEQGYLNSLVELIKRM